MIPRDKVADVKRIMREFDDELEVLKRDYRARIKSIMADAEKKRLVKLRKELKK